MKKDSVIGSFIGLAVGDALGTTVEFMPRGTFSPVTTIVGGGPFELKAGEWTDDTSMAVCLAQSIVAGSEFNPEDVLARFFRWYQLGENSPKGYCFDIGGTTASGIQAWLRSGTYINNTGARSAGNGGIMRLAPAAMANHKDSALAGEWARDQSATTHGATECVDSADFLARYLVNLYNGVDIKPIEGTWCKSVNKIVTQDYRGVDSDEIESSGYVIHTLQAALWAVANSSSFKEAVLLAVNLGNDADTVGAVTGQIAGALYGLKDIPQEWVDVLYKKNELLELAEKLYDLGER